MILVREEADLQEALWLSAPPPPSDTASAHGGEAVLAALRDGLSRKDSGRIAEAVSSDDVGGGISVALREAADALATAEQEVFIWRRLGAGVEGALLRPIFSPILRPILRPIPGRFGPGLSEWFLDCLFGD